MKSVANGIWVDGHGDTAYEEQTAAVLTGMLSSTTVQAILAIIRANGMVVIEPFTPKDEVKWGRNALAETPDIESNISKLDTKTGGTKRGSIHFTRDETTKTVVLLRPYYMPSVSVPPSTGPGTAPDELLLHELVHMSRGLGGTFNQIAMPPSMSNYDNEEEFFAVLITNIYLSERGRSPFRDSHRGYNPLPAQFSTSEVFLYRDEDYRLIEKFYKQHPVAAPMLAKVNATFNPIRAYSDLSLYGPGGPPPPPDEENIYVRTTAVARDANFTAKSTSVGAGLSDSFLISILAPRFRANDVIGYGGRARHLEQVFKNLSVGEATILARRLELRGRGDKVAALFHDHLSTATRQKSLGILRKRN